MLDGKFNNFRSISRTTVLLLVVLLLRRLVSGNIVLVRVRDNAKIPFFRLLGAELHLGDGSSDFRPEVSQSHSRLAG